MKEADVNAVVEVADQLPAEARAVRKKPAKKSAPRARRTRVHGRATMKKQLRGGPETLRKRSVF